MQTKLQSDVVSIYTPARSLCTVLYTLVSPGHRISLHFRHTSVGARKVTGLWQVSSSMAHISIMDFLGSSFSAKIWEVKKPYFSVAWTFVSLLSISLQSSKGWWRYHVACRMRTLIIHTAWSIEGWQDNHFHDNLLHTHGPIFQGNCCSGFLWHSFLWAGFGNNMLIM